nr:TPA_asm: triple gene block protein 1 [Cardamom virus X]
MESLRPHLNRFQRTQVPLPTSTGKPVVVHTVAGAGKTTVVREILHNQPNLVACTYGVPDPPTLTGLRILGPTDHADIVDEYPAATSTFGARLLLADPLQHRGITHPAHYVSSHTYRFGQETCSLLASFGIHCTSDRTDKVTHSDPYTVDPVGQIIAIGAGAEELLQRHHLEYLKPCQTLGLTFEEVTILSDQDLEDVDPVTRYIAVTRHREKLLILT